MSLTIVQGLLPDFRATSKIHKKSNFDQNHLKFSTQCKYMYKLWVCNMLVNRETQEISQPNEERIYPLFGRYERRDFELYPMCPGIDNKISQLLNCN